MAKVFLSYASPDEARANEIFGWLRDAGHEVFFDRDPHRGIEFGEDWKLRLYRELRRTDAVIARVRIGDFASFTQNSSPSTGDLDCWSGNACGDWVFGASEGRGAGAD